MRNNLLSSLIIILVVMPLAVFGQSTIRSPYSQRGVGESQSGVFAAQQAMGGIGVATRIPNLIDMANPASLTAQDTNSFVFDVGVNYKASQFESNGKYANHFTSNINHLAASFPVLAHRWYSSFALLPYSKMGYSYDKRANYVPLSPENKTYEGTGGLSRFNWSNGFIITKNISIGVSASYLFGSLTKTNTISYPFESSNVSNSVEKKSVVGGFYFNYGAQYHTTNVKDNFVFGINFQNQAKVKARYDELFLKTFSVFDYAHPNQNGNPSNYTLRDTIDYKRGANSNITLPTTVNVGASWNHDNKLIVGIEANYEKWSKATFFGVNEDLKDKTGIAAGFQYTPNSRSYTNYLSRVHYRLGTYYYNSELEDLGKRLTDYGVSAGLGVPFFGSKSTFNLSYQYGVKGSGARLSEKYSFVSFGFSFYDVWFIQHKLN